LLLTYIGKENARKNKTNTDLNPNPTANPDPQSTKMQNERH